MAGLNLTITAGTAPFGSQLPGSAQTLLNFCAAYLGITGAQTFNGINFGSAVPSPENQSLPWFKTDSFGNPIGLFSWNGLAWTPIPTVMANGAFANAPQNPAIGTEYYATDIGCTVIYGPQGWTTASGTVGDYKFVEFPTITAALAANPGWAQATNQIGLALAAAGGATSITANHPQGQVLGEEQHTQQITELVAHTHPTEGGGITPASATGNVSNPGGILAASALGATQVTGGGSPFNVLGPRYYTWLLVKQF
jgi:hypothetical protein